MPPRRAALRRQTTVAALAVLCGIGAIIANPACGSRLMMRDGRILEGRLAQIAATIDSPKAANQAKTMVLVDDGLRRIFVPQRQVQEANELDAGDPVERFEIPQQISESGSKVAAVGEIFGVTEFDDFGRRIIRMETNLGPQAVIQGITEITPEWTKLECVDAENMHFIWDMRIATNTIPRDVLGRILAQRIDPKNLDQRLKIVRLYVQSERFKDAETELQGLLAAFPDLPAGQKALFEQTRVRLRQTNARRILEEIEARKKSGQHRLAFSLLQNFPTENVAGETLQAVSSLVKEYNQAEERGKLALKRFDELLREVKDSQSRLRLTPIRDEINAELSNNTLERTAAFMQFQADDVIKGEEKIALMISGWLAGSDFAVRNLPTALSMYDVRSLIQTYLAATVVTDRQAALEQLRKQEGFTPELTARIIALMKPPVKTPDESAKETKVAGMFDVQIDYLTDRVPINYTVQLPQEYDPHRRYPTIVALHGAGNTPEHELTWWAGQANAEGRRFGQADRFGYIVIAPAWSKEQQTSCNYSEDEHAAVLYSLRDAYRRFSIDTDRVFISGHSMGGDAAWEMAMAHPDLWAGFIGISARADKTLDFYWENAEYVPTYLVCGEMDGALWIKNAAHMDRYLSRGNNATVVQMKGRGREHFSDELLRLFDWMSRQKRDPFPRSFKCRSVRHWDGSFWWVETRDPPERSLVDPDNWPPRGATPNYTEVTFNQNGQKNNIFVKTGAASATVWLSPELVNFKLPSDVYIRGVRANKNGAYIEPDAAIILEDARTRSDRLHPFWARVDGGK